MWLEALLRVDSACIQSHCAQRLVAKVWCVCVCVCTHVSVCECVSVCVCLVD